MCKSPENKAIFDVFGIFGCFLKVVYNINMVVKSG